MPEKLSAVGCISQCVRICKAMHYITRAHPLNVFFCPVAYGEIGGCPRRWFTTNDSAKDNPNTHTHHNAQHSTAFCSLLP